MRAHSIDEVIERLDHIVLRSRQEKSRTGFFATLYRQVTVKVGEGVRSGRFQDAPRMERLDVVFANRYLEALERYQSGELPSRCWQVAFQGADRWRLLVLQHLLLGMNAHINLDLGIAAAQTCPGQELADLKPDFDQINSILSESLDEVQAKVAKVSPLLGLLDRFGGRSDEAVISFSMRLAREAAWKVAERLAPLAPEQRALQIGYVDQFAESLALRIRNPGKLLRLAALVVRIAETRDVPSIIDALS